MTETIFKGDQITSLTDLENYINTGCPVLIGKELVQADTVMKTPFKDLITSLNKRQVYKSRDMEHFNSSITVKELVEILRQFPSDSRVRLTGDYGSETETIVGFSAEPGWLTIMTDLCSG